MAITTAAQFNAAMKTAEIFHFTKASTGNTLANVWFSPARAAGAPTTFAIPTAATVCDETTLGGFVYKQAAGSNKLYLAEIEIATSVANMDIQLHDRLAHTGGLVGNVTTVQTTNLPLDLSQTTSNLVERRGAADYSEIQWWLEWYTATGSTIVTVTVNYTAADDTTGSVIVNTLSASVNIGRCYLILSPLNGKFIKRVDSIQLSASTGTAGNFGITATRAISGVSTGYGNFNTKQNYFGTGLAYIPPQACLAPIYMCSGTASGTVAGRYTFVQG